MNDSATRLDLLIYAHDGRGFGHVSRSVAIGAAVRRLFPDLKVLLLTGFQQTDALIDAVSLDWIKLPSYRKKVINGKARSRIGHTNLKKSYLAESRTRLIRAVVEEYRPRIVLVDHQPQGKSDELIDAIRCTSDAIWILGVRGVVGRVKEVWSSRAAAIFEKYYKALFWYGDDTILGREPLDELNTHFGVQPRVTGYVSRLKEVRHWYKPSAVQDGSYAGTIAIPWGGDASMAIVQSIHAALSEIGDRYGSWQLFLNTGVNLFEHLPYCNARKPGPRYLNTLPNSKVALIYGGYNSITDVLVARIPAIVLLRSLDDREQQRHVARLADRKGSALIAIDENNADAGVLKAALEELIESAPPDNSHLMLNGAESAARILAAYLGD